MGLKAFHSRREIGRSVVVGVAAAGLVGTALAGAVMAPAGAVAVAAGVSPRVTADDTVLGTFEALGTGVDGDVRALAVSGDDTVYAGGDFTSASGKPGTSKIAAWSNADDTWHALGTGITGIGIFEPYIEVSALALQGDDTVYAGGFFPDDTSASGVPGTSNIAAWSNADDTWHALGVGSGVDGAVFALAVSGDDTVYAGGQFTSAGGKPGASNIAAWSHADDTWHALGGGVDRDVFALALQGDDTVYAGGNFTYASGVPGRQGIAAWSNADGTWQPLGAGVSGGSREVRALAMQGDDTVYAGGAFLSASGVPDTTNIAAWSTVTRTWHPLGGGVQAEAPSPARVWALAVDDTRGLVYAGGDFTTAGDDSTSRVAVWDVGLGEWIALQAAAGEGAGGNVLALALDDSVLYLGGDFLTAGGVAASRIARWTWDAPSVVAVPASGDDTAPIVLEGSGLIGVTGVSVDDTPVAYTRDDSTTISLTLPGGLSAGCHAITVDAVGGRATTSYAVPVPPSPPAPPCPWGPPSPPTPPGPPTPPNPDVYPPGAPTSALGVAGDRSASVSWVAPTSAGSFPVTDYEVASAPTGGSCLVKAPALTCTVSGLANGTSYTFTVRALNGAGWGAWSGPSNAVTPSAPVVKAIQITGSRDASETRVVRVSGITTGLVGELVTPWVRFPGQTTFTAGTGVRTVAADGTFAWSRATGKKVHVYFTHGSIKSNTVVIPAR